MTEPRTAAGRALLQVHQIERIDTADGALPQWLSQKEAASYILAIEAEAAALADRIDQRMEDENGNPNGQSYGEAAAPAGLDVERLLHDPEMNDLIVEMPTQFGLRLLHLLRRYARLAGVTSEGES